MQNYTAKIRFLSTTELMLNTLVLYYKFDMSEPAVLHWERVIHKNVRSGDGYDIGNIISEAGETITVMQGSSREYNIPKSAVDGFDGSEVHLSMTYSEVQSYKVA
jgi:hypothetical protein